MKISKAQAKSVLESNRRINLWHGAVRSGKTVGSILRWLQYVLKEGKGNLLMCGKTERTLKRNVLDIIQEWLGDEFNYNRGTGEIRIGDRLLYAVGANDERAEQKIRGVTLGGAYCDEITLYPKSFFEMLLSRLSIKGAKLFATTNPDSPYHYLKKDYIDRAETDNLDLICFHFKIDENPFLDPFYVSNLKQEYTGLWYKRFIDGAWVSADGSVYDMWDESKHVIGEADLRHSYPYHIVGVDYGISNPTTFVLIGWKSPDEIHVLKEYYYDSNVKKRQKTDEEYGNDFKEFVGDIKPLATYIDPSALSFINVIKRKGFKVKKAKNDVLEGIQFVSRLLYEDKLKVHTSCKNLKTEFASYVWDSKAQERGEDKPVKQNDHLLDSIRYSLFSHFSRKQNRSTSGGARTL